MHRAFSQLLISSLQAGWPACVGVACFVTLFSPVAVARMEVWLSPFEPVWRTIHGWPPNDYMQLFEANAPWQTAARGVKVFEITEKFVLQESDDDLSKALRGLTERHIRLAMLGPPLVAKPTCGKSVEGFGPPHDIATAAARIKQLGGELNYLVMDEPLYYGHWFNGRPRYPYETVVPTPCHAAIEDMAHEAAGKISELARIFPDITIGQVDSVGVIPADDAAFAASLEAWIKAYEDATSRKLAFFDLDAAWPMPAMQSQFRAAVDVIRKKNIPLGVIFNGTRMDQSDEAWLAAARQHIKLVRSTLGGSPDRAIFETWTDYPRRMLPEGDPNTLTGLVKEYVENN